MVNCRIALPENGVAYGRNNDYYARDQEDFTKQAARGE
jgi:hypothetical protein